MPLRWVGPLLADVGKGNELIHVPLATYETPLWPSTARGAKISRLCGGITTTIFKTSMTRSVVVQAKTAVALQQYSQGLQSRFTELQRVTESTSRFARLLEVQEQLVGNLWYLRFVFETGDASGHNMATKAAGALQTWLLTEYPSLQYVSISGNVCTDKKVSAVNSLLGRGKHTTAEITIPEKICQDHLRCTPSQLQALNMKKNLIGSQISGGVCSANAHFANALLAFYLATGQDAANIVEGSQGFTYCEQTAEGDLYFAVTLPNIIVGTVGNGKHLPQISDHLDRLGCQTKAPLGENAKRLAKIIAATVLCSELSLLAAQTHPDELIRSHMTIERRLAD